MTPKIVREMDHLRSELFSEKKLAQTARWVRLCRQAFTGKLGLDPPWTGSHGIGPGPEG